MATTRIQTLQGDITVHPARRDNTTAHIVVNDTGHWTHADLDLTAIEQLIDALDQLISPEG